MDGDLPSAGLSSSVAHGCIPYVNTAAKVSGERVLSIMIEIYPSPDHVAAFRISGRLTGADYETVSTDVKARLARHQRLGILVDLTDFEDITPEAAWKDIRFSLSLIGDLRRFPREAVISDKQWVRTLAKIADPLLPHVTIRVFGSAERDAALAWVSEVTQP